LVSVSEAAASTSAPIEAALIATKPSTVGAPAEA
jgi:hypothetical protein